MKGGGWMDGNWDMTEVKRICKVSLYKYLFSILLAISCIYLVFATIIFMNACINLHKTSYLYPKGENHRKLIDAPIFEYLKTKNFLVIDKFFLNADSNLKPSSVAFWTVTGIMLGIIILIVIHYFVLKENDETKQESAYYHKGLNDNIPYIVIASFPYLFIFIIVIWFNTIQVKNNNDLNNLKITADIKDYRKDKLQDIKKDIQRILYEDTSFNEENFKKYIYNKAEDDAAAKPASLGGVKIDLDAIVLIYKRNLKVLNKSGDKLKQYRRKYINYIDEYFELLKNGSSSDDNYTKFYLFGLIEYKENDHGDFNAKINEYRVIIKAKDGGEDGNGLEQLLIKHITGNIRAYFIGVISFYTIFCVAAIMILIYFNETVKLPLVYMLIAIIKAMPTLETFSIVMLSIIIIAAIVAIAYIIIPLIYKWTISAPSWMFY